MKYPNKNIVSTTESDHSKNMNKLTSVHQWPFFKQLKNTIILIIISIIAFTACEKREVKMVKYLATDATSDYTITYRDQSGILQTNTITAESAQDKWNYSFMVEQGEIVYLSGKYSDINSALKLIIYVDGKIYKQSNSVGDTLKYLTVSGVVPY